MISSCEWVRAGSSHCCCGAHFLNYSGSEKVHHQEEEEEEEEEKGEGEGGERRGEGEEEKEGEKRKYPLLFSSSFKTF